MPARARPVLALAVLLCSIGTAATTPAVAQALDRNERGVLEQANAFRRSHGLGPLQVERDLQSAAEDFAAYMARTDRYGHEADGRRPVDRVAAQGYDHCLVAENIAYEFSSVDFGPGELPTLFMTGWVQSPGHRANLLEPAAVDTGVAVAQSRRTRRWYAVQVFGRPQSRSVQFRVSNPTGEAVAYQLDDRRYELPARTTMTHRECTAPALTLLPARGGESTLRPADGERWVVVRPAAGGRWRIERAAGG